MSYDLDSQRLSFCYRCFLFGLQYGKEINRCISMQISVWKGCNVWMLSGKMPKAKGKKSIYEENRLFSI